MDQYLRLQYIVIGLASALVLMFLLLLYCAAASRGPTAGEIERWHEVQECVKRGEPRGSMSVGEYQALLAICEGVTGDD